MPGDLGVCVFRGGDEYQAAIPPSIHAVFMELY